MAQSATTDTFAATLTEGPYSQGFGEPTLTRVFAAPRELVFRAFIEPEQFVRGTSGVLDLSRRDDIASVAERLRDVVAEP